MKQIKFLLVLILIVGCDNQDEVVFARIDDFALTADFIKTQVLVDAKISELSGRPIKPARFNAWANGRAMKILGEWVVQVANDLELKSRGVVPSDASRSRAMSVLARKAKIKHQDENDFYANFGELKDAIGCRMDMAARVDTFVEMDSAYRAKDEEITKYITTISNRIEVAERINRQARNAGKRAWDKLSNGGDWAQIAKEFSQDTEIDEGHVDFWRKWLEEESINVVPPEVVSALKDKPVGYFTQPIETDEGLLIVKIFERDGEYVTLGRILFLMGEQLQVPDRKTAKTQILKEKRVQIIKRLTRETFDRHQFVYPMGNKFHYEIWK